MCSTGVEHGEGATTMSQTDAVLAANALKLVVLENPGLKAIVEQAKNLKDLEALWKSAAFRAAHDAAIQGVTEADVRAQLAELSDEQLDGVAGGVLIGLNQPTNLSPRGAYSALLLGALGPSLGGLKGFNFEE
jgi:hypothetical protein